MKRRIKQLFFAAASIAVSVSCTVPATACGGRGGRSFVSVSRGHYPVARQPVYIAPQRPICNEPPAIAPVVAPPINGVAPVHGQIGMPVPGGVPNAGQIGQSSATVSTPTKLQSPSPAPAAQPSTVSASNAETSALQMLVSMSGGQSSQSNAAAPQTPSIQTNAQGAQVSASQQQPAADHVGRWTAALPGNQSVQLQLNADGSFVWTANRAGKSSMFQGQFRLAGGQLTLVRSNDLQKMAGSWTGAANQFTFKLDGATSSGIAFKRS